MAALGLALALVAVLTAPLHAQPRPFFPRPAQAAPESPLVPRCRTQPQEPVCRQLRRLCAMQAVRPEVVATCRTLGWYGDTLPNRIRHLCPLDPSHPDCEHTRSQCEQERADTLGLWGAELCREMGWGSYAYAPPPPDEAEPEHLADLGAESTPQPEAAPPYSPPLTSSSSMAGPVVGVRRAGLLGLGAHFALVDPLSNTPDVLADTPRLYGLRLDGAATTFAGSPLASTASFALALGEDGSLAYRLAILGGLGTWVTPHASAGLVAGLGLSGLTHHLPLSVDLPARAFALVHLGDHASLLGWAQLEWRIDAADSRQSGSSSLDFADVAQLAALVVLAPRRPANLVPTTGLYLGALYDESDGAHIFSIVLGLGAAQEPWNQ